MVSNICNQNINPIYDPENRNSAGDITENFSCRFFSIHISQQSKNGSKGASDERYIKAVQF